MNLRRFLRDRTRIEPVFSGPPRRDEGDQVVQLGADLLACRPPLRLATSALVVVVELTLSSAWPAARDTRFSGAPASGVGTPARAVLGALLSAGGLKRSWMAGGGFSQGAFLKKASIAVIRPMIGPGTADGKNTAA